MKKHKIFALAFITIMSCLSTGGILGFQQSSALNSFEIQSSYEINTVLEIPPLVKDGITYTSLLTFPDGTPTLERSVKLSQAGNYLLTYSAVTSERNYCEEYSFSVNNPLFSFDGEGNSAYYGTNPNSGTHEGLNVTLTEGGSIKFNQLINVKNITKNDTLFEAFVIPDVIGRLEFETLSLTFVDAYNPNIYLKARARQSSDGELYPYSYWLTGGNGQPMVGYELGWDKIHINNEWGTPVTHSFYGTYPTVGGNIGDYQLSFAYDSFEKIGYASNVFIAEYDNGKYFKNVWSGFESDYVYLTITASNFAGMNAHFMITNIKDVDLSINSVLDTEPPEITVHTNLLKLPDGVVYHSYPIPEATALDKVCGQLNISKKVYIGYSSKSKRMVNVKNDTFTPLVTGEYSIVYESTDYSGNKATVVYPVNIKSQIDDIVITPVGEIVKEIKAGHLYTLPKFNVTGGVAPYKEKYTYSYDGEVIEVSNDFVCKNLGSYQIIYSITDFIGQEKTYIYTLTVVYNDSPVFYDKPILPKYFISGSEYYLPDLFATDYSQEPQKEIKASIQATCDGKSEFFEGGSLYTPVASTNNQVSVIKYIARDTILSIEIPVILPFDTSGARPVLLLENYFVKKDIDLTKTDTNIEIIALKSNSYWEFANPVVAQNASITFTPNVTKSLFEGLYLTLTDSTNSDETVTVLIMRNGLTCYLVVDEHEYSTSLSFNNATDVFQIGYSDGTITLGSNRYSVERFDNKKIFTGFSSNMVYISMGFIAASSGASYNLSKIDNQVINNTTSDRIGPKIALIGAYGGTARVNDVITLNKCFVSDVLDSKCISHVTVTSPDGKIVNDLTGKEIKQRNLNDMIEFKILSIGQYNISYYASDTFNVRANETRFSYVINVEDCEGPEIHFTESWQTTIKVGEYLIIPNFTVSDNTPGEITIIKTISSSDGTMYRLPEGTNSMKVLYTGEYTVHIMALDASGNASLYEHTVNVVE